MKFLTVVAAIGVSLPYALAQGDGTTVQTQQGDVAGTLSSGVRQFLGIPYAVANRWEAPQPPPSRSTTLQATDFGDTCVQALQATSKEFLTLIGLGDQNVQESENCLSVNIWAPSVERKQKTAVMLWIYGGGFGFGTSNTVYYEGQNMVKDNDDILVVSFNYRLTIFGSPHAPQLSGGSQSANFGLLDLKAAIEWVHSNIAAFGGDPERIVLFGESAGSLSADAYLFANPTDTIVKGLIDPIVCHDHVDKLGGKGVIQESGSLAKNAFLAPQDDELSTTSWTEVAKAAGCGSESTSQQLSCMKAVPFRSLGDAVISSGVSFAPAPDGITYFSDATARSASGKFLHVPLLVGSNAQEGDIFVVALEELDLGFTIPGLTQLGSDLVTKLVFTCPAGTTANDHAKAGVPTWRYRYEATLKDLSPRSDLRAFHSAEIPVVFGTLPGAPNPKEVALSKYMQSAWVAFARDPAQGLTNFGWPKYSSHTQSLAQLGNPANASGVTFTSGAKFDGACGIAESSIVLVEKILGLTGGVL